MRNTYMFKVYTDSGFLLHTKTDRLRATDLTKYMEKLCNRGYIVDGRYFSSKWTSYVELEEVV